MRKLALMFLFGFVVAYVPLIYVFTKVSANVPSVLAEGADENTIQVVLQTIEPTEAKKAVLAAADEEILMQPGSQAEESESVEPSSDPEPTQTPEPTKKPSLVATSTPEPTVIPTETPNPTPVPTETPTPLPTATPDVWAPASMEGWFAQYAGQYGVDKNVLERLANCESHFNASSVSPNGSYAGMFQFSVSTWQNYRIKMGADPNPDLRTNPEESIKTASFVIQQQGTAPWPACLR